MLVQEEPALLDSRPLFQFRILISLHGLPVHPLPVSYFYYSSNFSADFAKDFISLYNLASNVSPDGAAGLTTTNAPTQSFTIFSLSHSTSNCGGALHYVFPSLPPHSYFCKFFFFSRNTSSLVTDITFFFFVVDSNTPIFLSRLSTSGVSRINFRDSGWHHVKPDLLSQCTS